MNGIGSGLGSFCFYKLLSPPLSGRDRPSEGDGLLERIGGSRQRVVICLKNGVFFSPPQSLVQRSENDS